MAGHVISVADCKRQGIGLYYNWLFHRSPQQDSCTNDVRRRPGDVTRMGGDVTRRYREFRSEAGSKTKTDLHRSTRDRNPPAGCHVGHLDPLIHDRHASQQLQRLPRQRRRRRPVMTSRTDGDVTESTSRDLYTSRSVLVTSQAALSTPRDLYGSPADPMTSSRSLVTSVTRPRKRSDGAAWWTKSYAATGNGGEWNMEGLLESAGRMSCIQLQLVEEQQTVSLVQVHCTVIVTCRCV